MLTAFLALVVAFFVSKSFSAFVLRLFGWGAVNLAKAGGEVGAQAIAQVKSASGMVSKGEASSFPQNLESFGTVVFGTKSELTKVVSSKVVDAVADKLSTEDDRAEVAARLASAEQ